MDTNTATTPSRRGWKIVLWVTLGIALVCLGAAGSSWWLWETRDDRMYHDAARLLDEERFGEALSAYQDFLQTHPDSPRCTQARADLPRLYLGWGQALAEQDKYDESVRMLEIVLDDYPDSPQAAQAKSELIRVSLDRSRISLRQDRYQAGIDALLPVLARYPSAVEVEDAIIGIYLEWGKYLSADQDFETACTILETALENYPHSSRRPQVESALVDASLDWSQSLARNGDYEQAIAVLEVRLERSIQNSQVDSELLKLYPLRGSGLIQVGNYEEGIDILNTVLRRWPDSPAASEIRASLPGHYLAWGMALFAEMPDSYEKAVGVFTLILDEYEDTPQAGDARQALFDLHMLAGDSFVDDAGRATQQDDLSQVRQALKDAEAAFGAARGMRSDSSDARRWITWLDLDLDREFVFVVPASETGEVTLDCTVREKIAEGRRHGEPGYNGSIAKTKIGASILDVQAFWSDAEAGYDWLDSIIYKVKITVPPNTPPGMYRLYLSITLYSRSTFNYSFKLADLDLITRHDETFYVLVPPY